MTSVVNPADNPDIDGILWGWKRDGTSFSYSFPTSSAAYLNYAAVNGFEAFNTAQQQAVRDVFANISSFTNLTFTETSSPYANFRFAEANSINYTDDSSAAQDWGLHTIGTAEANPPSLAWGSTPPWTPAYAQGDAWYNHNNYNNPLLGSYAYTAGIMHETGHNLGLKHGHMAQPGHGYTFPALPTDHNSYEYSVMTYSQFVGDDPNDGDDARDHPTTYMQDDIAALQYMYGANYNYNSGNTVYQWSPTTGELFIDGVGQGAPTGSNTSHGDADTNFILMTIWDGNGVDTYDFSNYASDLDVDLAPGAFSSTGVFSQLANLGTDSSGALHFARGNIANALLYAQDSRSLIENAIGGSGDDTISGNQADNTLSGNAGDDILNGEIGNDILIGGRGADQLIGGAGMDTASYRDATSGVTASLLTGTGTAGVYAIGDTFVSIEWLEGSNYGDALYGNNSSSNVLHGLGGTDFLYGLGGSDSLYGDAGNDVLNGGTGGDYLDGGSGFDIATFDNAVTVNLATGSHSGEASGDTYVSIERFVGSGFNDTLIGNESANDFMGMAGADTLTGNGGDDTLEGGAGADRLDGGAGNDTASYAGSSAGVYVDLSIGKVAYGDASGDTLVSIENLIGSAYNDSLVGDAGDNNLQGGAGNDTLQGGAGNDLIGGDIGDDSITGGAGADYMDGMEGSDWAYYSGSPTGVSLQYDASAGKILGSGGDAEGDTLVSIENIAGTSYADTLVGGPEDNILRGGAGGDHLDGGAGNDTLDYRGSSAGVTVNLLHNTASGGDATGDTIVNFENVIGSNYADLINGNAGRNVLNGGAGDDVFGGEGGGDTEIGGTGNDTFYLNSDDVIVEYAGEGTDRLIFYYGAPTYVLGAGVSVEIMEMADATTTARNLTGNEFDQSLTGNEAANILDGGGGADTMRGLGGDDSYFVDNAGDLVFETSGQGTDTVFARTSYALAAGQSVETLRASSVASTTAMDLTGNELAQTLLGNAGANRLDGGGGADTMRGYGGDDAYFVDNAGDLVFETSGQGTDTVFARASYALQAGQSVEILRSSSVASTSAMNLTGNSLAQTLYGNAGANILDGGGGGDRMTGYGGDDTYVINSSNDLVFEASGQGSDTVNSRVSYVLAAGQSVETLKFTSVAGTGNLNLTGNSVAQTLTGNNGNNVLDGGGGGDSMRGYAGDDTYVINSASDLVFEANGQGSDTINARVSYVLAAGQSIETLKFTSTTGTGNLNLTGNAVAQTITGNNGNNILDGKGGADILRGYGGADSFKFSTTLGANNIDHIVDFSAADDTIRLDQTIFSTLGLGTLSAGAYKDIGVAGAVVDSTDRILYDHNTGALYYDADGSGTAGRIQFAILDNKPAVLTNADFFVVA